MVSVFWNTYQDRSLKRWNGIKTGVFNVDMDIHKGIPSYITFGSYKDPLMVSGEFQVSISISFYIIFKQFF